MGKNGQGAPKVIGVKRKVFHDAIDAKLDQMQFTDIIDNRYGSITVQLKFQEGEAKVIFTERTSDMVVDVVELPNL